MRADILLRLALLLAPVSSRAVAVPRETIEEHQLPARPGQTLVIDLGSGGTLAIRGSDEPVIRVRARLGGRDARATRVSLVTDPVGARLSAVLTGSRNRLSTSHAFEVRVPRRHDIEIRSSGGDVRIEHVEGEFRGSTRGGSIVLVGVRGRVGLATRGGNIEVEDSHLDGWITTRGGAVRRTRVTGDLRTGREAVAAMADEPEGTDRVENREAGADARGERLQRVDQNAGPIEIDDAPGGAWLRTGAGGIHVLRSGGPLDAKTGYGDIEIGPTLGSVRAITGTGDIRVTIGRNLRAGEAVDLTSGLGTVTLELPAGFDGALDLRTGYTERHGRPTRVRSDWKVRIDETGWVRNGGTPQRYVHGTGRAGRGGGRVLVRTTNGDIVVRRAGG